MQVIKRDGSTEELNVNKIHKAVEWACGDLENVSLSDLETSAHIQFYNGISTDTIQDTLIKTAQEKYSAKEQEWTYVASRLLLQKLYKQTNDGSIEYPHLRDYLTEMISLEKLDKRLLDFDLDLLNRHIDKKRDLNFNYIGLQTVYDRYLLKNPKTKQIRELPQHFFMRVAMGVALAEPDAEKNSWAIEFYNMLSNFEFMSSTPTLFNAGTLHPQLSSCFLLTMDDSLEGIMGTLTEAAQYSKFSGGVGLDMTRVRASGSYIKSTGGRSGGIVPYAKMYNDTLLAFDQGGKRLGAGALYLEPWHADIEEFLDLKNTSGDDRRRAHDIFPALWLNDLFMKRVLADEVWSLFSPSEVPALANSYGEAFEAAYIEAEANNKFLKQTSAKGLWKKMLNKLFESGTYWPCFKDVTNERYPQKGSGMVRSSNLCTEITLRTDKFRSAVCNLGSINLAKVKLGQPKLLEKTVKTAVRFLDDVITVGLIPHAKGKQFNFEDRAIGLGVMGYAELLVQADIDYESTEHLVFANKLFEMISYYAIEGSHELAIEKGYYPTFAQSDWSKGIVPIDTVRPSTFEALREFGLENFETMDWKKLREKVKKGMRNSCLLAIAPTATISNITNTNPCTELPPELEYQKGNLSGNFVVVAPTLKYGKPHLCKTGGSVNQQWTVRSCAVRQLWIDQSQSTNIWVKEDIGGKELSDIYTESWRLGNKTMYYLRSQAPELKTEQTDESAFNQVTEIEIQMAGGPKVCSILDPDCEACQ